MRFRNRFSYSRNSSLSGLYWSETLNVSNPDDSQDYRFKRQLFENSLDLFSVVIANILSIG